MAECKKMMELVSAYVDGECSEEEAAELKKHLDECASCRALLSIYENIRDDIFEAEAEPPAALRDRVMERIRKEPIPFPVHPGVKTKKFHYAAFIKIAAAAACIAIVIYAAPQLFKLGKSSESVEMYTRMDAASASAAGAPNTEMQDMQAESSAKSDDMNVKSEENLAEAPQAAPAPSDNSGTGSDQSDGAVSPNEGFMTSTAAPSPAPAPGAGITYGMEAGGGGNQDEAYYAMIVITGELPEVLTEYDMIDAEDGTVHIVIPAEVAKLLIADNYTADVINENATEALVIYSES